MSSPSPTRCATTVVLAMSADGKIADFTGSAARFGSAIDKKHLEQQVAQADAVLFGAGTLRAYGTTLRVSDPLLLQQRLDQHKSPQPIQIVASRSAQLNPDYPFFRQPVPRWLLTTSVGAQANLTRFENPEFKNPDFENPNFENPNFERIVVAETETGEIDWVGALHKFHQAGIDRLAVLGGGVLVASLLALDLIDELRLTVCPLLLGGTTARSPVAGTGFLASVAPRLELLNVRSQEQEVFLHYKVSHAK